MSEQIWSYILTALGGGLGAAIITAITSRLKNRAEVHALTLDHVLKLEGVAMDRYQDVMQSLDAAERSLSEARKTIDLYWQYIGSLRDLLSKAGIVAPELPSI